MDDFYLVQSLVMPHRIVSRDVAIPATPPSCLKVERQEVENSDTSEKIRFNQNNRHNREHIIALERWNE